MRLGIDIGGTKTAAVLLDDAGLVVARHQVPTERGERVVESVLAAAQHVLDGAGARPTALAGVGIGVPGQVDADRSSIRNAVHLGLGAFDVGAAVRARLGVPVTVDNDVKAAVVGARHLMMARPLASVGGARGPLLPGGPTHGDLSHRAVPHGALPHGALPHRDLAYLGLGTGIAAGISLDGIVVRGATGVAGEIGHVPVPGASGRCRCGQRGCLETIAAGWALAERWDGPHPAATLLAAARAGDARGEREWAALVDALAHAIRMLVLAVDVGTIAIGGGVSALGEPLRGGIRERLDAWAGESPFLASLAIASRVHIMPSGSQPAAVGAAILGSSAWKS